MNNLMFHVFSVYNKIFTIHGKKQNKDWKERRNKGLRIAKFTWRVAKIIDDCHLFQSARL